MRRAKEVLRRNDLGRWTKPAPDLYPHQWNWDSAFIAIGISHYDTNRAAEELRSLLRGQWRNGLVPHIVFSPKGTGYFPGPTVWQSHLSPDAPPGIQTSGITQPPILATAALAIWENAQQGSKPTQFLAEIYPKIFSLHSFLYRERDPDQTGLVVVLHPWESGLDNSPPYLEAGSQVQMAYRPTYQREDLQHVAPEQRPTDKAYDLFVYLLEQMRATNWNQSRFLQQAPLQVQDVLFNSILCRANRDLAAIAEILDEDSSQPLAWHERCRHAINDRLWDEESGVYYSRDRIRDSLLKENSVAGLTPLYGLVAPADRAQKLIQGHLLNSKEFWPENGYPVPTAALSTPSFDPRKYWRGPTWINTNWLVLRGLESYGYGNVYRKLRNKTLELVRKSDFREYFDPFSGQGYGSDSFSWSAALTVDLLEWQV